MELIEWVINEDDETGVTSVAFVDNPAVKLNWQQFSQTQDLKFAEVSKEKRIVSGALMLANTPILRQDKVRGEYKGFFSAETIEKIVHKFHRNGYEKRANPMHESAMLLPNVYLVSDYIINRERGINPPKGFESMKDGSWYGEFKVDNLEIWEDYIKTGIFKGFSVEGYFDDVPSELTEKELKFLIHFLGFGIN